MKPQSPFQQGSQPLSGIQIGPHEGARGQEESKVIDVGRRAHDAADRPRRQDRAPVANVSSSVAGPKLTDI